MSYLRHSRTVSRRLVLHGLVVAVASSGGAAILAACGQTSAPSSQPTASPATNQAAANATTTSAPVATSAPSGEKVTIKVFNRGTPVNEVVKGGADEYAKEHPNVSIDWQSAPPGQDLQKMLILAASGTSPDIQWQCTPCDWLLYVHAGLVMDILPLVRSHNYDLSVQLPSAVAVPTIQGKMYGMPNFAH